jgi:hypothetical protein
VVKLDMVVEDGKVSKYRARLNLSFKYNGEKVISESYKKAKILS